MPWEIAHRDHLEATGPRYEQLAQVARVMAGRVCIHCGKAVEDDDDGAIWYHPETMSARCDGPDDEPGLYWSDMVRQAEPGNSPRMFVRWVRDDGRTGE